MEVFNIKTKIIKLFQILLILFLIVLIIFNIQKILKNYNQHISYNDDSPDYTALISEESSFYDYAMSLNYENQNYNKPYIPENFQYVEGTWNSGYTIQDLNGNQYVWIPCTNNIIDGVTKLEKKDFSYNPYVLSSNCYNNEYKDFINSALKYGGFYVSRFEIGKENDLPVSKKNVPIWNNVAPMDTNEIIESMYPNENSFNCELLNGYAYDTMISWILNTIGENNISPSFFEIDNIRSNIEIYTGRNSYNNIYDVFDDVQEITQENIENACVSRGLNKSLLNKGYIQLFETRLYSLKNIEWNNLTFRTMLYMQGD